MIMVRLHKSGLNSGRVELRFRMTRTNSQGHFLGALNYTRCITIKMFPPALAPSPALHFVFLLPFLLTRLALFRSKLSAIPRSLGESHAYNIAISSRCLRESASQYYSRLRVVRYVSPEVSGGGDGQGCPLVNPSSVNIFGGYINTFTIYHAGSGVKTHGRTSLDSTHQVDGH